MNSSGAALDGFEERKQAVHGCRARIDQRLYLVVQVDVADVVHVDAGGRLGGGGGYDDVVGGVDAGVGGGGREHGLEQDEEAAGHRSC